MACHEDSAALGRQTHYLLQVHADCDACSACEEHFSDYSLQTFEIYVRQYCMRHSLLVSGGQVFVLTNAQRRCLPSPRNRLSRKVMLSADARTIVYSFFVQLPLVAFHITVDICILMQLSRRNPSFARSFYSIYLFQSVVDMCSYFVSLLLKSGCLGEKRRPRKPLMSRNVNLSAINKKFPNCIKR